jgi:hypothetical protein
VRGLVLADRVPKLFSPLRLCRHYTVVKFALATRLYAGVGIRILSLLQAPLVWLNTSLLNTGALNLIGLGNPLASIAPKWLLYGEVAGWTGGQSILWGDAIYDPQGQSILWGDSYTTDGTSILWGDTTTTPDAR